jgi:hypothetical protein
MAKAKMTENSRKVYDFLKNAGVGVEFTTKEVQEALGFEKAGSVTGSVTGLVRKEMAERVTREVTDDEGKTKEVKKFFLTQKGYDWNPDAEVED